MTNLKESCGIAMPPEMPQELPALISLLIKNVLSYCMPAVASAVFPALAAHLHGVRLRYWDNVDYEATFMNVLFGRQSVGKGCIKKPIELIMEDIRLRDLPNRLRGPKNLLNLLLDSFTREQYRNMRLGRGKKGDGESLLRVWMTRKYIIFNGAKGNFCKTDEYIHKYRHTS